MTAPAAERHAVDTGPGVRSGVDASAGVMCLWDFHVGSGLVYRWGDYARLLGVDLSPVAGWQTYQHHVHPADVDREEAAVRHSLSTGRSHDCRYRVIRADGQIRWVLQHGEAIVGSSGAVDRVVGVLVDVGGRETGGSDA